VASGFVEATWEDCVVALKKDLYRALVLFPTGGRQIVTLLKIGMKSTSVINRLIHELPC
jgi:hypothetical protein